MTSENEKYWRSQSDEKLRIGNYNLQDYDSDEQQIILTEMNRRGFVPTGSTHYVPLNELESQKRKIYKSHVAENSTSSIYALLSGIGFIAVIILIIVGLNQKYDVVKWKYFGISFGTLLVSQLFLVIYYLSKLVGKSDNK